MDTSNWLAALAIFVSVIAMVLAAVSYDAAKRTANANVSMAQSNQTMAEAARESVTAARVAADAARESTDLQLTAWREEKRALLIFVDWLWDWNLAEDGTKGEMRIALRNEGQWPAYGTTVGAKVLETGRYEYNSSSYGAFDDETMLFRLEYTPDTIPPRGVQLFRIRLYPDDVGLGAKRIVRLMIRYRDGLGAHEHDIELWLGGTWGSESFTHSVVSSLVDGEPNQQHISGPLPEFMRTDT